MLRERRRTANYKPNRRLDRKSSRGMIYENEELRIRTININAEVERGQSDIRKLRRENEQLRREIWSLRDEYDRLNRLLKPSSKTNSEHQNDDCDDAAVSGDSYSDDDDDDDTIGNCGDESSCDTCKEKDDEQQNFNELDMMDSMTLIQNDQKLIKSPPPPPPKRTISKLTTTTTITGTTATATSSTIDNCEDDLVFNDNKMEKYRNEKLFVNKNNHLSFDHLSIVSEENLTNSYDDVNQHINDDEISFVPPLSHFENIINEKYLQQNITTTNDCIGLAEQQHQQLQQQQPINWDFNIQSPFMQRRCLNTFTESSPISTITTTTITSVPLTFSSTTTTNSIATTASSSSSIGLENQQKNPKHFFSPIKSSFKLPLRKVYSDAPPPPQPLPVPQSLINDLSNVCNQHLNGPPDICVANALGSSITATGTAAAASASAMTVTNRTTNQKLLIKDNSLNTAAFQNGGNLEELLMDIESMTKDLYQMNSNSDIIDVNEIASNDDNNLGNNNQQLSPPPYRSEMNLILNYNNNNNNTNSLYNNFDQHSITPPLPLPPPPPPPITPPLQLSSTSSLNEIMPNAMKILPIQYFDKSPLTPTIPDTSIWMYPSNLIDNFVLPTQAIQPQSQSAQLVQIQRQINNNNCDIASAGASIIPTTVMPNICTTATTTISSISSISSSSSPTTTTSSTTKTIRQNSIVRRRNDDRIGGGGVENINSSIESTRDESGAKSSSGSEMDKRKLMLTNLLKKNSINDNNHKICLEKSLSSQELCQKSLVQAEDAEPIVHSTPNSPHSIGRRHHHRHHHHNHHHRKMSDSSRTISGVSIMAFGGQQQQQRLSTTTATIPAITAATATTTTSKCSRRHSESTVISMHDNHHHNHHHHHHHGSIGGGGGNIDTSISNRNSNSLVSSRESSTSLSMRSQRRKISINSHNGGKIPWCGCWGNGCL